MAWGILETLELRVAPRHWRSKISAKTATDTSGFVLVCEGDHPPDTLTAQRLRGLYAEVYVVRFLLLAPMPGRQEDYGWERPEACPSVD